MALKDRIYQSIRVYLHRNDDRDIIEFLGRRQPYTRQQFIKEAVRHYINHPGVGERTQGAATAASPREEPARPKAFQELRKV